MKKKQATINQQSKLCIKPNQHRTNIFYNYSILFITMRNHYSMTITVFIICCLCYDWFEFNEFFTVSYDVQVYFFPLNNVIYWNLLIIISKRKCKNISLSVTIIYFSVITLKPKFVLFREDDLCNLLISKKQLASDKQFFLLV